MNVLALVPYPVGVAPGQRYRIEQWAPYLREAGVELTFAPFTSPALSAVLYQRGRYLRKAAEMLRGLARQLRRAWSAADYDAVLVHREASLIGPAWAEGLARRRRPALVYDFDDAVWLPYLSPTNRYLSYLKAPWKTAAVCRMARAVLVGNDYLGEYARRYNREVHVVPSTVSLREYRPRPAGRGGDVPVVGWTGSHSSLQYLRGISGALAQLRRRRDFRLAVIGVEDVEVPGVETWCRPWRAETEVEDLWDLDLGIMPLPDEPWARGKCGMKAIQYMGVGIPAVVSPVGANRQIVGHGETGYHATTEDEWVDALDRLLADAALRRQMGAAARRSVEERYSAEVHAPRVARVLREVAR